MLGEIVRYQIGELVEAGAFGFNQVDEAGQFGGEHCRLCGCSRGGGCDWPQVRFGA